MVNPQKPQIERNYKAIKNKQKILELKDNKNNKRENFICSEEVIVKVVFMIRISKGLSQLEIHFIVLSI